MRETIENALALRESETNISAPLPEYPNFWPNEDEERTRLRDYWRAIRKRLWLVAGLALITGVVSTIVMLRRHNLYEAVARVQVDLETSSPLLGSSKNNSVVVNNQTNDPAYFNTQLQVLAGQELLRRTVKALDLEHDATFIAKTRYQPFWKRLQTSLGLGGRRISPAVSDARATTTDPEEVADRARLAPFVDTLRRDLSIEPVKESRLTTKETRLIEISYVSSDPKLAVRIVNGLADEFAAANLEKKTRTGTSSGDFLTKRIAELQSQIREGEERLINYGNRNQILSLDPTQNTIVDRLVGLNKQLLEAENERKLNEAAYYAAQAPGAAFALAQETARNVQDAEQKLTDLQQKRAQLLVDATEEWPEVKEVDQQIGTLKNKIVDMKNQAAAVVLTNLKTRYEQSVTTENALRASFNQQRGETLAQNEAAISYRIIQQEIETNKNLLDGLLQRAKENDVAIAGTPNNVTVVDRAFPPQEPIGPQRLLSIFLAVIIAIAVSICLAILMEYLDNTLRTAEDVEVALQLPAIAIIPAVGTGVRNRSARLKAGGKSTGPQSMLAFDEMPAVAESYKQLRTAILLSTAGHAPKSLLITSAQPGEGKTTTAVNTATSLAQTGARVVLIDADLRRPTVHRVFDTANDSGLSTLLSRNVNAQAILESIEFRADKGVHLLTSGPIPPNPAELLGSPQMKEMLEILAAQFDHIVLDSPPIISVTDGVWLASLVEGVILVVHSGESTRERVRRTRQILRSVGARIFGVVLNNVKQRENEYYYHPYYETGHAMTKASPAALLSITK